MTSKFLENSTKSLGLINWGAMKATHFPEVENSENLFKKYSSKAFRKAVGSYFAGNMTSEEQEIYGKEFNINPRNLTLYNTSINAFLMFSLTTASDYLGINGVKDDLAAWGIWAFSNIPKTYFAIKNNKGYQPWTLGALLQNSTTYANIIKKNGKSAFEKAVENNRGTSESLDYLPKQKSIEHLVEYENPKDN